MPEQAPLQIPADKVAIGYVVTQYLLEIKDTMKKITTKPDEFIALINGLRYTLEQYRDKIFESKIKELKIGTNPLSLAQAFNIYGALMELLQRSGFMPVRAFDEVLEIPDDIKYHSEDKNGTDAIIQEA